MLRQMIVRIGAIVLAATALAACRSDDVSMGSTTQTFGVGDGSVIGGGTTFVGSTSGPSRVTATSITPTVSYTAGSQEELRGVVGDRIFFDTDSSVINSRAQSVLSELVRWMNSNPSRRIRIEGHADERGTREYNLALGDRRATAVVNYLTQRGISNGRLSTISFGKERPVAGGSNATAWTQNRRAVFRVQ